MDPTLVPSTHFESQFQICVYEHAILRIYISFFFPTSLGTDGPFEVSQGTRFEHPLRPSPRHHCTSVDATRIRRYRVICLILILCFALSCYVMFF